MKLVKAWPVRRGQALILPQSDSPAQTADGRTSPGAYLDIADLGGARSDGAIAVGGSVVAMESIP
jgi:hypothetical protein